MQRNAILGLATGFAALILNAAAIAQPAIANAETSCSGTIENTTITGDLRVPDYCEMTNVTVTGSVTVETAASLVLGSGRIDGDVTSSGFVGFTDSVIKGDVEADATTDYESSGSNFTGTQIHGDLFTYGEGLTSLSSSTVGGQISAMVGKGFLIHDSVVQGFVMIEMNRIVQVSSSEIYGGVSVLYTGEVDFNDYGGANYFGADVSIYSTQFETRLVNNIIAGNLNGSGNSLVLGSGNRVRGAIGGDFDNLQ